MPDCDLFAFPWEYPGPSAAGSGLLADGRFTAMPTSSPREHLARRSTVGRALVVAVGSNACPGVLLRKLVAGGVADTVPYLRGVLRGCAIGHSAHVSAAGYVAAAPYLDREAATPVLATLLDAAQLACVDRTEPNYVRRVLPAGRCRLDLDDDAQKPAEVHVYDSRWGVLASPGAPPLRLRSQAALHAQLRTNWGPYGDVLAPPDPHDEPVEDVIRRLAADARLRARVRDALRSTGWARPSGLAG